MWLSKVLLPLVSEGKPACPRVKFLSTKLLQVKDVKQCKILDEAAAAHKRLHGTLVSCSLLALLKVEADKKKLRKLAQACLKQVEENGLTLHPALLCRSNKAVKMSL